MSEVNFWNPAKYLQINNDESIDFALLVLNQPLHNLDELTKLWKKAVIRIAVDGGANRLHHLCSRHHVLSDFIPDVITGDFDSIAENVMQYYKEMGVETFPTPDQDHTDFTKALQKLKTILNENLKTVHAVIVLVQTAGRLDHIFSLIHTLYLAPSILKQPVMLVADDSISWLLQPGKHVITIPTTLLKSWCGLIPVGCPAHHVTTSGLKWNLDDQKLEFGGLISTSNTYQSDTVMVETDQHLLWSMGRLPEC